MNLRVFYIVLQTSVITGNLESTAGQTFLIVGDSPLVSSPSLSEVQCMDVVKDRCLGKTMFLVLHVAVA